MSFTKAETVSSINDIVVRYVNHLLHERAMHKHLLANQEAPDEQACKRISELSAKLEIVEHANRNMLSMIEQQKMLIDGKSSINGHTIIKEGNAMRKAHIEDTRAPERGEG